MLRSAVLIAAVAWPALAFAQAGQSASSAAPPVARIVLTPASPTVVAGQTVQLQGQAVDAQGKPVPNATVVFRGSGFEGQVTEDGKVLGGAPGRIETTVTARVEGQKPFIMRFRIPVLPGAATAVDVDPMPTRLLAGQEILLHAASFAADRSVRLNDIIAWSSSAPRVVAVGADGTLKALSSGKATLTAKAGDAMRTFAVEVLPGNIRAMTVTPANAHVRTGDVVDLKVSVQDSAGREIAGLTPAWSYGSGAGRMDPDGKFVAYDPGSYVVTATMGSHVASTVLAVAPRDVRRPASIVGAYVPDSQSSELWLHPNRQVAYQGSFVGKIHVLDVSNPAKPTLTDDIQVNARLVNDIMTTEDGKVLVATREGADNRKNGIVVFTLDDPRHPKQVGEFVDPVTSGVHSAYVNTQKKFGTFVYLTADGQGRMYVVNIDDPAHPKMVSTWEVPRSDSGKYLHDIMVVDGILYASYTSEGLWILDVGNGIKGGSPDHPVVISDFKYDLPGRIRGIESEFGSRVIGGTHTAWRDGKYVYITDEILPAGRAGGDELSKGYGGLQVIDVSDIYHPKAVAWYNPNIGGTHNVWVQDGLLYMGVYNGGFQVFDVSGDDLRGDLLAQGRQVAYLNPVSSKGKVPNYTFTWGTVVDGERIYVSDINNGFYTVKLEPKVDPYTLESGVTTNAVPGPTP